MARKHGRLLCRIWQDGQYKDLTQNAQWLYEALLSQANVNNAGVLALTPRPWARLAKNVTEDMVHEGLAELEAERFVVIDEDTAEVLIRTFIRNDGVSDNGKVFKNALLVARQVQSATLRRVLARELRKVGTDSAFDAARDIDPPDAEQADPPGEEKSDRRSEKSSTDQEGRSEENGTPIDGRSQPDLESSGTGTGASNQENSSSDGGSSSAASKSKPAITRGTRIPDDFEVTPDMVAWAREKCPAVDGRTETDNFRDYWHAKSGKDATKLDWVATWRTWMRNAQARARPLRAVSGDGPFQNPTSTAGFHGEI